MATLKKSLTITSAAGDLLTDALSLTMTKSVTVSGNTNMKLVTFASTDAKTIAAADGRSIVYLKNSSATDVQVDIYTDSDDGAEATPEATELIMEIKQGEFALFPCALDHALLAKPASTAATLEVGVFTV
jgi:hypothetical protein